MNPSRSTASLAIALLTLNMVMVACTHIKREEAQTAIQPVGSKLKMERIVGVTLRTAVTSGLIGTRPPSFAETRFWHSLAGNRYQFPCRICSRYGCNR